jgi:hypothetical protein
MLSVVDDQLDVFFCFFVDGVIVGEGLVWLNLDGDWVGGAIHGRFVLKPFLAVRARVGAECVCVFVAPVVAGQAVVVTGIAVSC